MASKISLEVHFHEADRVSVSMASSTVGEDAILAGIWAFAMYSCAMLQSVYEDSFADELVAAGRAIAESRPVSQSGVSLVEYPGHSAKKRLTVNARISDSYSHSSIKRKGFGFLGIGTPKPFERLSVVAMLRFLVRQIGTNTGQLLLLAKVAEACACIYREGYITITNHTQMGVRAVEIALASFEDEPPSNRVQAANQGRKLDTGIPNQCDSDGIGSGRKRQLIVLCNQCMSRVVGTECKTCRASSPDDFDSQTFLDTIHRAGELQVLTAEAATYRAKNFPRDEPLSRLLGSYFTSGYTLRQAEETYNHLVGTDATAADHPPQIRDVLDTRSGLASLVPDLANCLVADVGGSFDQELAAEQLGTYGIINREIIDDMLEGFVKGSIQRDKPILKSAGLKKAEAKSLMALNLLGGYYFRVGEEVVGSL